MAMMGLIGVALLAAAASGQVRPDTLVAGCSGGVTGGGGGSAITRAGDLLRWQQSGPGPAIFVSVGRDTALANRVFAALGRARFERTRYQVPSNMTCSLSRRAGKSSHEVAWAMGAPPAKIRRIVALFDEVGRLVPAKD
jgi:hypothetical protein